MDERLISRRFNVALSKEETADGRSLNDVRRDAEEDEEYLLRKAASPMDVKDAIKRILLAKKDRDFFRSCITWFITRASASAGCSTPAPPYCYKSKQAVISALLAGCWSSPCQRWMIWTG